jgi:hypothetical protein
MNRSTSSVFGVLLVSSITAVTAALPAQIDWDDLGPSVMVQDAARPIIETFDAYHRSQNSLMCKGEIRASLKEIEIDDVMFLSARAQRPNLVEVAIVAKNSMFPTDVFISNGTELFEQSMRLLNYMISPVSDDFQTLHERVIARSAPNVPVEIITSLMSDSPMRNLLQIASEPGLVRLVGVNEVNGVICNEIAVNEGGTHVWISKELPPRLIRYQSSPALMKPRYLPEGAIVTGPGITVDFKSWAISEKMKMPWKWASPQNSNRMATMHENAAGPGPESGFDTMLWAAGQEMQSTEGPSLTRGDDPNNLKKRNSTPLSDGQASPDPTLVDLQGVEKSLATIRNGRPAVVIFWVPGGKFSRSSMPGVIRAARGVSDEVAIIPIGSPISPELVPGNRTMPEELADWCDVQGVAAGLFGVSGKPAVFFIDAAGTISGSHVGPKPRFATIMPDLVNALIEKNATETEDAAPDGNDDQNAEDTSSDESPESP